jgi:hypothetical protein
MNLLKTLLESIEYNLLLAEGKDPVEILHYKFQNKVPSDVIDKVISIDPTKKKSYSQWLLSKWDNEEGVIVNGLKNGRIEKLFQHMLAHKEIQLQAYDTVKEPLNAFVPEEETVLKKSDKPTTTLMNKGWVEEVDSELANDFDIVFNEDNWLIAVPNTYEASAKLGENMNWCTAGGRSDYARGKEYYDHYLDDYGGKYYVNFDLSKGDSRLGKDYPYTRYQFHFESKQFMDKEDDPVELDEIGMPESAFDFYESEGYDARNISYDDDDEENEYEEYMQNRENNIKYPINDELYLCTDWPNDDFDDFTIFGPEDDLIYYLFSNDDERDPIDRTTFPNPHTEEQPILENSHDWFVILNGGDENPYSIAVKMESRWGGLYWYIYPLWKYNLIEGVNGLLIASIDKYGYFTVFYENAKEPITFEGFDLTDCAQIVHNRQCTSADENGRDFIEVITKENVHTLFTIDNNKEINCVIYKDTPANGEQLFTINNNVIEGEFRNYKLYNDECNYHLEQKLSDGNMLIATHDKFEGEINTLYNILDKNTKKPLSEKWFSEYHGKIGNAYYVLFYEPSEHSYYSLINATNGNIIGLQYNELAGIYNNFVACIYKQNYDKIIVDVIDTIKGEVSKRFMAAPKTAEKTRYLVSTQMIMIVNDNDGHSKLFDIKNNTFCFPELSDFEEIAYHDNVFLCQLNNNEKVMFDVNLKQIISRNVESLEFSKLRYYTGPEDVFITIEKTNEKCNGYNYAFKKEVLQNGYIGFYLL